MQSAPQHLKHCFGFTYIGLMLIVAIAGIALSGVGIVWKTEMQRENEKELRFAGEQYVTAIASYYECKVCGPQQLPKNLKDLLKDSRAPSMVRHLRKLYRDPMTRSNDWGLIKNGDRITGVYSKSKLEPLAKPYDVDLLKKKKNTTQPNNTTSVNQTNTNQTSFNQVNTNQAGVNQAGANNSSNNVVGTNVADLNKLDANKTSQPIKPKKPSYQDWQFVYGGAGLQSATPLNANSTLNQSNQTAESTANTDLNQNTSSDQPSANVVEGSVPEVSTHQQAIKEVCQPTYSDATKACRTQQFGDKDHEAAKTCLQAARAEYDNCVANIR